MPHDEQPDRGSIVDQMKYVTTVVLILKFEKILTFSNKILSRHLQVRLEIKENRFLKKIYKNRNRQKKDDP